MCGLEAPRADCIHGFGMYTMTQVAMPSALATYRFKSLVKLVMMVSGWFTCCDTRSIRNFLPSGLALKKGVVRMVQRLTSVCGAPNSRASPAVFTGTETRD